MNIHGVEMVYLFLVCGDAYYPVEGDAPTGVYGEDWCVVRASDGPHAVRIAALQAERTKRIGNILTESKAREVFSRIFA